MPRDPLHPGPFIREQILHPRKLNVSQAARLLGVGRPALSNLLNGRASLSPEMAARIQKTFGVDIRQLREIQTQHDTEIALQSSPPTGGTYAPPFLEIKASDIESWADRLSTRSRLAVLIRTLIHSTNRRITQADFPGNDDSQRAGWDGWLETTEATFHIPAGKSGWELSTTASQRKAQQDYDKCVRAVRDTQERSQITFLFVTPRRWPQKTAWQNERRAERNWKDVRVIDAQDLEQWLEQSIPSQIWLASEMGIPTQGARSLDSCWRDWVADCGRMLPRALFDSAVDAYGDQILSSLEKETPERIDIKADSEEEALAFLDCVLREDQGTQPEIRARRAALRSRVGIFTTPGVLSKLAAGSADFIPIISTAAVEKELAAHHERLRSIVVLPRSSGSSTEIDLRPLPYDAFEQAMMKTEMTREEIKLLARECGLSPTVLRRRLSNTEAIRTPQWANDPDLTRRLIPLIWAGSWRDDYPEDRDALSILAGTSSYTEIEESFVRLRNLEGSPVWEIDSSKGVVSKIDSLYATARHVTPRDVQRFFDVARLILSEEDPALDLPEDERFMASALGKSRKASSALRDGISETLVLLAVHGRIVSIDVQPLIDALVRELLFPQSEKAFESQARDLPLYAEAAPDVFLESIRNDLASRDPKVISLMRPVQTGPLQDCPRAELLWALETTAWSAEHLIRTVDILASLASIPIKDNWSNTPLRSIKGIFCHWLPQTGENIEGRVKALSRIDRRHPVIGWQVCIDQMRNSHTSDYNHRPRWRNWSTGHGNGASPNESIRIRRHALDLTLARSRFTREMLCDLLNANNSISFPNEHEERLWALIDTWASTASQADIAWLRDRVRETTALSDNSRAERTYALLRPTSTALEHAWLFESHDEPHYSGDELKSIKNGEALEDRSERVKREQTSTLESIESRNGIEGIFDLARHAAAPEVVGMRLVELLRSRHEVDSRTREIILDSNLDDPSIQSMIFGILHSLDPQELSSALEHVTNSSNLDRSVQILTLAPFRSSTWMLAGRNGEASAGAYWKRVNPGPRRLTESDTNHAVTRLIHANRPTVAYRVSWLNLRKLDSRLLLELLKSIANTSDPVIHLDSYRATEIFNLLYNKPGVPPEELSKLELWYIDILDSIPELEKTISQHPELFCEAVKLAHSDDNRSRAARTLLGKISTIPGSSADSEERATKLSSWISEVRRACPIELQQLCDYHIGELLSNSPPGDDEITPCEWIREVLDSSSTQSMEAGFVDSTYNSRGFHSSSESGYEERTLAEKYLRWAKSVEYTSPRTAEIFRKLSKSYTQEATSWESHFDVRRRLLK